MTLPTKEEVLVLLRSGTSDQRIVFLKRLPAGEFTPATTSLISSNNPGAFFDALANATLNYCDGQHADWGAVLAAALHERAVELWQTDSDHAPLPTAMSRLARGHIKALTLLGRSSEALNFTEQYIAFYEKLDDAEILRTLGVLHFEAQLISQADRVRTTLFAARPGQPCPLAACRSCLPNRLVLLRKTTVSVSICPRRRLLPRAAPPIPAAPLPRATPPPPAAPPPRAAPQPRATPQPRAMPQTQAPLPETRFLNAEIRDHDKREPLKVGTSYTLEFGVDLQATGDASTAIPGAALLFQPGEDVIELTILLESSDFQIAPPEQQLQLPRSGASLNRPRFDITPLRAGRGTLTAVVCKDGNFLLRMDLAYSIGRRWLRNHRARNHTAGRSPPPPASGHAGLSLMIKPAPAGGYECTMITEA